MPRRRWVQGLVDQCNNQALLRTKEAVQFTCCAYPVHAKILNRGFRF